MGRNKGESFRKEKFKKIHRVECPKWCISEDTLQTLKNVSKNIGKSQSRLVDMAIQNLLNTHLQKCPALDPHKLFSTR